VIEYYFDLRQEDKDLLLPALERHIDRGGRLILAYTELDQWPELQELVGVRTVGEPSPVFKPKSGRWTHRTRHGCRRLAIP
jgi:hypothetical protein